MDKQGYIGDLNKKTKEELIMLLTRQQKLLQNKKFLNSLPDKGEKIKKFKEEVESQLEKRKSDMDEAVHMLSGLSLEYKPAVQHFELLDSDDEADIEIADVKSKELDDSSEVFRNYFARKMDKIDKKHTEVNREPFKPYKTLKSANILGSERVKFPSDQDSESAMQGKVPSWREDQSATTPAPSHFGEAKTLTLEESCKIIGEQEAKVKDIQVQHAAQRLAERMHITLGSPATSVFQSMNYRSSASYIEEGGLGDHHQSSSETEDD